MEDKIKKGDVIYYAQCLEPVGVFELLELTVRTVEDTWFVATEKKEKHAFLFGNNSINKTIFFNRKDALMTVKEAEENCQKKVSDEIYYEEN